jgi:hypothetical protein
MTLLVVALSALTPFATRAYADQALGAILLHTYLKTESESNTIEPYPFDGFTPTTVSCPVSRVGTACTIRVEVSSEFRSSPPTEPGTAVFMTVLIDGSAAGVSPSSVVLVTHLEDSDVKTFTWLKTGVLPGLHTVHVIFQTEVILPGVQARNRTLTIEVYRSSVTTFE